MERVDEGRDLSEHHLSIYCTVHIHEVDYENFLMSGNMCITVTRCVWRRDVAYISLVSISRKHA